MSATIAAQAVTIIVSPALTRLYTPAELGEFGIYLSVLLIASVVASLRYEAAVVAAKSRADAVRLLQLAVVLVLPVSLLTMGIVLLLAQARVLSLDVLSGPAMVILLWALVAAGWYAACRQWAIRLESFRRVGAATVGQSMGRSIGQITLAFAGIGSLGLMIGDAIGRTLGGVQLGTAKVVARSRRWGTAADRQQLYESALEHRSFFLYGTPSSLVNSLALYLPVPLIAQVYGAHAAGLVVLVQRVMTLPLSVLGSAVADVFYTRLASHARSLSGRPRQLVVQSLLALTLIAIGFGVAIAAIAPAGFEVIFGGAWADSGQLAVALVPWAVAQFVAYPVSRAVFIYRAQHWKLVFDVVSLASVLIVIAAGDVGEWPLITTLLILSLAQATAYGILLTIVVAIVWRNSRYQYVGERSE